MTDIHDIITRKSETKSKAILMESNRFLDERDYIECFKEFLQQKYNMAPPHTKERQILHEMIEDLE